MTRAAGVPSKRRVACNWPLSASSRTCSAQKPGALEARDSAVLRLPCRTAAGVCRGLSPIKGSSHSRQCLSTASGLGWLSSGQELTSSCGACLCSSKSQRGSGGDTQPVTRTGSALRRQNVKGAREVLKSCAPWGGASMKQHNISLKWSPVGGGVGATMVWRATMTRARRRWRLPLVQAGHIHVPPTSGGNLQL